MEQRSKSLPAGGLSQGQDLSQSQSPGHGDTAAAEITREEAPFLPGHKLPLPFTRVDLSLNNHQDLDGMKAPSWPLLKFSKKGRLGILVQILKECTGLEERSDVRQSVRDPDRCYTWSYSKSERQQRRVYVRNI